MITQSMIECSGVIRSLLFGDTADDLNPPHVLYRTVGTAICGTVAKSAFIHFNLEPLFSLILVILDFLFTMASEQDRSER